LFSIALEELIMADQDWKTDGLYRSKYVVLKPCPTCDGSGSIVEMIPAVCHDCGGTGVVKPTEDKNAAYFVLRIDCGPDGAHDPNACSALRHYADCVRGDNPKFATDIMVWLDELAGRHYV
jgi:hypothetical protein